MGQDIKKKERKMRAMDLFCGAGLSSSGARNAGAQLVAAIDLCPVAATTFASNFPDARVINKRLESVSPTKLRDDIGDIDLLLASPECTNHTCAKGSSPRSEESRATAMQVLRFAKTFSPRWIVMENVVHMRPWSRYSELLMKLKELGYNIRESVLDASEFGVPQRRKRLFVLCDNQQPPAPVTTPRMKTRFVSEILDSDGTWRTTLLRRNGRATDTLARADRALSKLGEKTPFLVVYYGSDGSGGWQPLDRPLRTVTTVDRFALVTPSKEGHRMRMLQVPELKRAMGVPPSHKLVADTRREQIRLLGNGVCPPVMRSIVSSLTQQ